MKPVLKHLLLSVLLILAASSIRAQVGIGTVAPDSRVVLEIQSTEKGILLPRVNISITPPPNVEGVLVFDPVSLKFKVCIGGKWISVNPLATDENDNVTATNNLTINNDVAINGSIVNANNATINANTFVGNGTIPIGGIIMWSGTTLPSGWALCDGKTINGYKTPDLRGRFIVGMTNEDNQNYEYPNSEKNDPDYRTISNNAGLNKIVLTGNNLPPHTHDQGSLRTELAGEHQHIYHGWKNVENGTGDRVKSKLNIPSDKDEDYAGDLAGNHTHIITGETGKSGGIYTYDTKTNPPRLNPAEECFQYKCTKSDASVFYSSMDLTSYSGTSSDNFTIELENITTFYDLKITSSGSGAVDPNTPPDLSEVFFKANIKLLHMNNIESCVENNPTKPYINPAHDDRYSDNEVIRINERWDAQPFDNRPPYYVLAFIMRIQ